MIQEPTVVREDQIYSSSNPQLTQDEKNALAGTSGTPSASNKYVTDQDPRNSNSRTPVVHDIISLHNGFPGDTSKFLRGDGVFAVPPGGGLSDGDKGDITVSGGSTIWTIDPKAVTYDKIQDISAQRVIGRKSVGSGTAEELTGQDIMNMLDIFSDTQKGVVPGSGGGIKFLRADGAWVSISESDIAAADSPGSSISISSTTDVSIVSRDIGGIVVGSQIEFEAEYTILNSSGATKTYTHRLELGGFFLEIPNSTTQASNASNQAPYYISAVFAIVSGSSARCIATKMFGLSGAEGTAQTIVSTRMNWKTYSGNLLGTQTIGLKVRSSAAGGTQTLTLNTWRVRLILPK